MHVLRQHPQLGACSLACTLAPAHRLVWEHGKLALGHDRPVQEHDKPAQEHGRLVLEHDKLALEHGKELVRDRRVLEGCMEQAHDTQEDCKEPGSMEQEEQECIASWVWPPDSQPGLGSC